MGYKHSKKEPRVTRLKTFPKIAFDICHYYVGFYFCFLHFSYLVYSCVLDFFLNYILVYIIYIMHQCFEQHKNE